MFTSKKPVNLVDQNTVAPCLQVYLANVGFHQYNNIVAVKQKTTPSFCEKIKTK